MSKKSNAPISAWLPFVNKDGTASIVDSVTFDPIVPLMPIPLGAKATAEQRRNVSMMCAAPDMLAALKLFVASQDGHHPAGIEPLTVTTARSAINKAEGRS